MMNVIKWLNDVLDVASEPEIIRRMFIIDNDEDSTDCVWRIHANICTFNSTCSLDTSLQVLLKNDFGYQKDI